MRTLTYGGTLLIGVAAAIFLARRLGAEPGEKQEFPPDASGDWERLALYIGINEYPADDVKALGGCVSDMKRLRAILKERYGFKRDALLTNEMATRDGVAAALRELLAQTRRAVANGVKEPLVVLAYAGHGNLVTDQDDDEKQKRKGPKKDSSWVMYDSDASGSRDIRDDDLRKILQAIQNAGATIVLFVDACHSGTSFRGSDDAQVRSVRSGRGGPPADGPKEPLFPDLPDAESPRLASFAACQDSQEAWEEKRNGVRGGCFTYTLVTLLQRSESVRSYEEFARLLTERFAADWPGGKQHPLCRVSDGMEQRLFFGRDVAPPYARITRPIDKKHVQLGAGSLHGLAQGTRIEFFLNLDDLVKRRGILARGKVESCDAGTAAVALDRPTRLPATAVARMVPSSLPTLRLHLSKDLSEDAKAALRPLQESRQALFAEAGEPYTFAVADDPGSGTLGIYIPGAWKGDKAQARPVARIAYDRGEDLLWFAQLQRLLQYRADESRLLVEVVDENGNALPRDPASDLVSVARDTLIRIRVRNRGSDPLHLFAWVYEEERTDDRRFMGALLWPSDLDDDAAHQVRPGKDYLSERAYKAQSSWSTKSRLYIRILATDRAYDPRLLRNLINGPVRDRKELQASRSAANQDDGLLDLLEGVATGSGATRGLEPTERIWATAGTVLDVDG